MAKLTAWLDERAFPAIVAYATHRAHISGLVLLGIGLILGGSFTAFELIGGNYTNVTSAVVACIVLSSQMAHHKHVRQSLQELHAKVDAQAQKRGPGGRFTKAVS